ncbi:hypothetical protein [Morganella morganii]|uniref:hypothetical protein n=1 Tax=Morganella morganii TaxID=582 RepID=UPI002023A364|nr:hypothetical protein [Morganella morganii]
MINLKKRQSIKGYFCIMKQLFSVLFLWSISLSASADTDPAVLRSPPDAANAKLVISSLRQAKITPDNPLFSEFNDLAFDAMHNKNYTSAIKFFSENMLRYPSPQMIINYTDANLMMLTDNKNTLGSCAPSGEDLQTALRYYHSALLTDNTVNLLSCDERKNLTEKITCLEAFQKTPAPAEFRCRILHPGS